VVRSRKNTRIEPLRNLEKDTCVSIEIVEMPRRVGGGGGGGDRGKKKRGREEKVKKF